MTDQDYQRMLAQIKRDEGSVRDKDGNHIVYKCTAGARTIGYGHNLDANPIDGIGDTINEAAAITLLKRDVDQTEYALKHALPWTTDLDSVRYAVLVNMVFNMGLKGLLGFKNTLAYIRTGDYVNAARNMRASKWAKQVGDRANRLANQMCDGVWN